MCDLSLLTLDVFSLLSLAAPVGPSPTVTMGAPVPRPRGPPPPPGDENREVRLQEFFLGTGECFRRGLEKMGELVGVGLVGGGSIFT